MAYVGQVDPDADPGTRPEKDWEPSKEVSWLEGARGQLRSWKEECPAPD